MTTAVSTNSHIVAVSQVLMF